MRKPTTGTTITGTLSQQSWQSVWISVHQLLFQLALLAIALILYDYMAKSRQKHSKAMFECASKPRNMFLISYPPISNAWWKPYPIYNPNFQALQNHNTHHIEIISIPVQALSKNLLETETEKTLSELHSLKQYHQRCTNLKPWESGHTSSKPKFCRCGEYIIYMRTIFGRGLAIWNVKSWDISNIVY